MWKYNFEITEHNEGYWYIDSDGYKKNTYNKDYRCIYLNNYTDEQRQVAIDKQYNTVDISKHIEMKRFISSTKK